MVTSSRPFSEGSFGFAEFVRKRWCDLRARSCSAGGSAAKKCRQRSVTLDSINAYPGVGKPLVARHLRATTGPSAGSLRRCSAKRSRQAYTSIEPALSEFAENEANTRNFCRDASGEVEGVAWSGRSFPRCAAGIRVRQSNAGSVKRAALREDEADADAAVLGILLDGVTLVDGAVDGPVMEAAAA